jgi:hypothetical protein
LNTLKNRLLEVTGKAQSTGKMITSTREANDQAIKAKKAEVDNAKLELEALRKANGVSDYMITEICKDSAEVAFLSLLIRRTEATEAELREACKVSPAVSKKPVRNLLEKGIIALKASGRIRFNKAL